MRRRFLIVMLLAGILTGTVVGLGTSYVFAGTGVRVIPGVSVHGVDLRGLKRDEFLAVLEQMEKKILSTPILLKYKDKSWSLPLQDVDLRIDAETTADDALRLGREGAPWRRWQERRLVKKNGFELPFRLIINEDKFEQKITALTAGLGSPARDASFRINNRDSIEIIPGQDGLEIDKKTAYRELIDCLVNNKDSPEISLNLVQSKPHRTTEMVTSMGLKGLLASYSTSFDRNNVGRAYNIRVAASALDGLLVSPGQEVSFNEVVGPRSSEAGYKNAKVIINDEFVEGIGGGVCQVSTTLYNSILLSNLEIVDRTNHSLPIPYVPIGRDATVVYGSSDLRFLNNTESYIYIRSFIQGGQLTFKVYGNTDYKVPVSIRTRTVNVLEPKTINVQDPNLKKGEQVIKQEGAKGYEVAAERVIMENGVKKIDPLPGSIYKPVNRIVAVGIREEGEVPVIIPPSADDQDQTEDAQERISSPQEQPSNFKEQTSSPQQQPEKAPVKAQQPAPGVSAPPVVNEEEETGE